MSNKFRGITVRDWLGIVDVIDGDAFRDLEGCDRAAVSGRSGSEYQSDWVIDLLVESADRVGGFLER